MKRHIPAIKINMGGPGLTWAYTFKFGDFNWSEQFLRDCRLQKLKLDFVSVHYYGNISSLHGEYETFYPKFLTMLEHLQGARDAYSPATPIFVTEWGARYNTNNTPMSVINGNNVGAAWTAAFLNTMLENGVDDALYLVTTDLLLPDANGKPENIWGWPSLFVNSAITSGEVIPKAPAHVFDMVRRLTGRHVKATRTSTTPSNVNSYASADTKAKKITVMLWNYGYNIRELSTGEEGGRIEDVHLSINDARKIFGIGTIKMERFEVSENISNAYRLFTTKQALDSRANLQRVENKTIAPTGSNPVWTFKMPPSSVSLVVLSGVEEGL